MFLAGDIGGTKVNLALCEVNGHDVVTWSLKRYASQKYASLSDVLVTYLSEVGASDKPLQGACFGVPGPVIDGRCVTVNLPWQLDPIDIAGHIPPATRCPFVRFINDLEAAAFGLSALHEGKGLVTLRAPGRDSSPRHNQALISPGTGLGEALLIWDGTRHVVSASEGGHADFGPQDEEQIELLRWLWPRHKHVSWEHVASGPAIHRLYRFLIETGREKETPDLQAALAVPGVDPSPIIVKAAEQGSTACLRAVDLWLFCLGAEAGNLALKTLARGGLFIGGGIVPHAVELLKRPAFFAGLNSKGRMSSVVASMGVHAVTDSLAALYGAALSAHNIRK